MKLVSVEQMRAMEKEADGRGVSYAKMMERAGQGVAQKIRVQHGAGGAITALVGTGNNGGDALVALAALAQDGWRARAYLIRPRAESDTLVERLNACGGEVLTADADQNFNQLAAWLTESDVLLDGVLGTGVTLPLKEDVARALAFACAFRPRPFVVAVDCPSGVDCASGAAAVETIPADVTICMEAVKTGLMQFPAFPYCGRIETVSLGLPADLTAAPQTDVQVMTGDMARAILPLRPPDAHKGSFGTALIAAGSVNYTGAALLAGEAAYRSGAGLVRMAVPGPLHAVLAGHLPEATWLILPHELGVIAADGAAVLAEALDRTTALLLGPGWGTEETTGTFLKRLLSGEHSRTQHTALGFARVAPPAAEPCETHLPPLVLDADALRLLARLPDWPRLLPADSVLTPHPGEMAALTGLDVAEIQAARLEIAIKYAAEWGQVVVLKGALTVVADPTGRARLIPVATAALARAGTGDVLAGLVAGLRAQGRTAFEAASLGAWLHAQSGLLAEARLGTRAAVLAGDVLRSVPEALAQLAA